MSRSGSRTAIGRWLLLCAALLALPAAGAAPAQHEGVDVGNTSSLARLVPAAELEGAAGRQYQQLLQQAAAKHALAPASHPQLQRLRVIAQHLIPTTLAWNPRARDWRWEVNLIGSKQINAFCMPGGKIAFFTGIIDQLHLSDDELAMVMGHEMAHALREHARARMAKNAATSLGANIVSQVLGLGQVGQAVTGYGAQLLTLQFSRSDETEADLVGMEMAARAGYNPQAAIGLWQKMAQANKAAPPQWLSTHPSSATRITELERNLPKVMPLYEKARRG